MMSVHVEVLPHLHRTLSLHQGARGAGRRRPQPRDAGRGARGDRGGRRLRARDVGQPRLRRQTFLPRSESKVRSVRALLDGAGNRAPVEIDGGIDLDTVDRVVRAGRRSWSPARRSSARPIPRRHPRAARRGRAGGGRPRRHPRVSRSPMPAESASPRQSATRFACATPKPTRWAWSTTRTTSCGSRSAGPSCCATSGWTYRGWKREGTVLPVIEAHCEYRQPARYDDEIEILARGAAAVAGPGAVRLRGLAGRRRATGVGLDGARGGRPQRTAAPAARAREETLRMNALVTGAAGFIGSTLARPPARAGAPGHRHRLLHRLLPAAAEGGEPRRRSSASRGSASSSRRSRRPTLPVCSTTSRTSSTSPRRPASARAGGATSASTRPTTSRRRRCCSRPCVGRPIERLVYASSSSVYGDGAPLPMRETALPQPLSPYGVTKLAAEQLCYLYHANHGVPSVSLRYFTVYGPRQRPDMALPPVHPGRADGRADHALRRRRTDARLHVRRRCGRGDGRGGDAGRARARVQHRRRLARLGQPRPRDASGAIAGRRLDVGREAGPEGRHARHLRRHVARPAGPRVRPDGRARRRACGRIRMAGRDARRA